MQKYRDNSATLTPAGKQQNQNTVTGNSNILNIKRKSLLLTLLHVHQPDISQVAVVRVVRLFTALSKLLVQNMKAAKQDIAIMTPALKKFFNSFSNSLKLVEYPPTLRQNMKVLANYVSKERIESVRNSMDNYACMYIDESTNVSDKGIMLLYIFWISSKGKFNNRLIHAFDVSGSTTGAQLTPYLSKFFDEHKLKTTLQVGLTDGAPNVNATRMNAERREYSKSVMNRLTQDQFICLSIWCAAHRFQCAFKYAITKSLKFPALVKCIQQVYTYFKRATSKYVDLILFMPQGAKFMLVRHVPTR